MHAQWVMSMLHILLMNLQHTLHVVIVPYVGHFPMERVLLSSCICFNDVYNGLKCTMVSNGIYSNGMWAPKVLGPPIYVDDYLSKNIWPILNY